MATHVLKTGDSLEVNGRVTVVKCGLHSEGGAAAVPTVTVEVSDDKSSAESQELSSEGQTPSSETPNGEGQEVNDETRRTNDEDSVPSTPE